MKTRKRGGMLPLKYFDASHKGLSTSANADILESYGNTIRPALTVKGGKHKYKTRGGFVPSIMEGFVAMASKYIVPLSVFSGYKLMTKKSKGSKRSKRSNR
jgi:hypothetical protein